MRCSLPSRPQLQSIRVRRWLPSPRYLPFPARNSSDLAHDGTSSLRAQDVRDTQPKFELDDEEMRTYWTTQGRHLLRAILRECTYLPDPQAREYIHRYAISRFRKYAWRLWKESDVQILGPRLEKKRKEARQSLSLLKRANEGERLKLLRVLLITYGRAGRRRRELLAPLLTDADYAVGDGQSASGEGSRTLDEQFVGNGSIADSSTTTPSSAVSRQKSQVPSFVTVPSGDEKVIRLQPRLNPMLDALARSQIKGSIPQVHMGAPRSMYLEFPALNSWLRPMPQKRIKNMLDKWKAALLARLHPPLPTVEWDRLQRLATGQDVPRLPIPYRRRAGRPNDSEAPVPSAALTVLVVRGTISLDSPPQRKGMAGSITPRAMRRLWWRVFEQCPRMDWDAQRKRWNVTWPKFKPHSAKVQDAQSHFGSTGNHAHLGRLLPSSPGFVIGYWRACPLHWTEHKNGASQLDQPMFELVIIDVSPPDDIVSAVASLVEHSRPSLDSRIDPASSGSKLESMKATQIRTNSNPKMTVDEPFVTHATREDVPEILRLIQEHAEHEGSPDSCITTESSLLETLSFSPSSARGPGSARALLACVPSSPSSSSSSTSHTVAGLAVYVQNYSTWRGRPGIYLDDLFVRPQFRKRGLGRLLIQQVAQEVINIGGCRLEWVCGATNHASRSWYRALGAREMGEWIPLRLEWEALEEVAGGNGRVCDGDVRRNYFGKEERDVGTMGGR